MKLKKIISLILFGIMTLSLLLTSSCIGTDVHTVPSGFVGKILYPTGFDDKLLAPGQINLGVQQINGQKTRIVYLESTTVTIVEQFRAAGQSGDGQDHRIVTRDGVPTVVDMYVRLMLPDDEQSQNNIFLQITPTPSTTNPFESYIMLKDIYAKFVEMDTRNRVRSILSSYENFQDILINYDEANDRVTKSVIEAFKDSGVPLKLQDAQLSQVLPDPQVWDSEVKKKAAEALESQIQTLGQMIASNPGYLDYLKWQTLKDIATVGSANGTNTLIIVTGEDSSLSNQSAEIWAANISSKDEIEKMIKKLEDELSKMNVTPQ
jgi:hypothetical protein